MARAFRAGGGVNSDAHAQAASAASADARSDAARASIAARRGALRRWMSLTRRDAPRPDDPQAIECVALATPVGEGEEGRERRALTGRGEMANRLEAGRAHVGPGRPLRRAAKRERLVAQAMPFRQEKQRLGIDLVDPDRAAPARAGAPRGDEIERLLIELDRVRAERSRGRSRSRPRPARPRSCAEAAGPSGPRSDAAAFAAAP